MPITSSPPPGRRRAGRRRRRRRHRRSGRGLRRARRRERHDPADQDDDARRLPRRRRALRDVVRVHRRGRVGRLDHPAARRPDRGRCAAATGPCSASPRRSRRPTDGASHAADGADAPRDERRGDPRDEDRRPRHHRAQGRRRRGRQVGARQRLPAHARRARGARLLRPPQPDLHGRPVRRRPRRRARPDRRRRHADHADDPDRRSRGCRCGSSASASTASELVEADVFLLTDDEPDLLAGGPGLSLDRSEPANDLAARRPALRRRAWSGCPSDMWFTYLQVDADGRATSTTTSPSRPTRPRSPTIADTGVDGLRGAPGARTRRRRCPLWPHGRRRGSSAVIVAAASSSARRPASSGGAGVRRGSPASCLAVGAGAPWSASTGYAVDGVRDRARRPWARAW